MNTFNIAAVPTPVLFTALDFLVVVAEYDEGNFTLFLTMEIVSELIFRGEIDVELTVFMVF